MQGNSQVVHKVGITYENRREVTKNAFVYAKINFFADNNDIMDMSGNKLYGKCGTKRRYKTLENI